MVVKLSGERAQYAVSQHPSSCVRQHSTPQQKKSKDFASKEREITPDPDETKVSYDVTSHSLHVFPLKKLLGW